VTERSAAEGTSEQAPDGADTSLELAAVTADNRLLDALGRGEPVPPDDRLAGLFAAWRTDLATDPSAPGADAELVRAVLADEPVAAPSASDPFASASSVRGSSGRNSSAPAESVPGSSGRPWPGRGARRFFLAAAATVVGAALLGLGVNHAGPTSPLWPIVEVVYPDRVAVRAAEQAIASAASAATVGRYDDARDQLDQALTHVAEVRDPEVAGRLRADIQRVRVGLPRGAPDARATPGPGSAAPTSPPDRSPAPPRTPAGPASPAPPPAASEGGPTSLPSSPVLRLPIPAVPSLLPSLLPSGLPLLPDDGCLLLCPPG
jgi:hypothetical protein